MGSRVRLDVRRLDATLKARKDINAEDVDLRSATN